MNSFRSETKGQIDRTEPISFTFDGKSYQGYAGDTLASALLANGVHFIARSFKYHRPRGIIGLGCEDPAGLVQIGSDPATTIPNTRATEIEIYEGLEAFPQNCWPSLSLDFNGVNDLFARFLPAGFYYKTFMGPPGNWMTFEERIRKAAGLGVAPHEPDPDRYEHINQHCDILVVGGGRAGLEEARNAAAAGMRVVLVEQSADLGGRLLFEGSIDIENQSSSVWIGAVESDLAANSDVLILRRACAFGYYGNNWVGVHETLQDHLPPTARDPGRPQQRLWHIRAKEVVLATGAIERPLVFHGNDRPGIMLAGAVRGYLHRYGVLAGKLVLVFTNNNNAWKTAFDLANTDARVVAIVDTRAKVSDEILDRAKALKIPVYLSSAITSTEGRARVSCAYIASMEGNGQLAGDPRPIVCDVIAMSGGWSPNVALFSQSRGKLRYDNEISGFVPAQSWQNERSVGAAAGFFSEDYSVEPAWELPSTLPETQTRAFVDFQNDVTAKDLHLAVREGYRSVELAKRYTTLGMGTDQGKTSSVNGFGILSQTLGQSIPETGITTYRPPYKPVTFGAVAGHHVREHFHPRRTTPMHEWHVEANAIFETVGDWLRARVYPKNGESFDQALMRECRAARTSLGVLDASTLGKIDVRGPGAREFLNRIYSNAWLKLQPGRCRYGLMLNEDGMVFDDGVTACLGDDHFHMTTTTGGAGPVLAWLENYHQTEWPELDLYMTSVTEQWAVASICGPKSPDMMRALLDDIDPDPETFPFMAYREGHIDGVPVRIFRISFTGELSYEINVAARYGLWLWRLIMEKGAAFDITPYGTEGMHLLRAEKGFIIVGQDTDGTVTPIDLGMDWAVKKTADFVGKRSLSRSDTKRSDRRQLVGLLSSDPNWVMPEGSQVINTAFETPPKTPMIGHVTSSYFSPNLNRSIAFALINGGHSRQGQTVYIARSGQSPSAATICGTDFLSEHGGSA